jgi:hypothetical protein
MTFILGGRPGTEDRAGHSLQPHSKTGFTLAWVGRELATPAFSTESYI